MSAFADSCERMEELVPKVVDREALDWEVRAVDAHLASCPSCSVLRTELESIGALVRKDVATAVASADFSRLWRGIEAGMDRADAQHAAERVRRIFSWTGFSRFAAATVMAAAFAWAVLLPGRVLHDFHSVDNRVEVSAVEGGEDNTVMIYESHEDNVTFIWVIDESYDEEGA